MSARFSVKSARKLVLVLGDQLNTDSAVFDDFDSGCDAVLMVEVKQEAAYVPQHKHRLVLFFSAMRHFRDELGKKGYTVHYSRLDARNNRGSFAKEVPRWLHKTRAEKLLGVRPKDVNRWRWHHSMYIDAIDWVSLPNVIGMSQYAGWRPARQ